MGLFDIFKKKKNGSNNEQSNLNKIWDLWSENKIQSPYRELMTYQSEINNGGHDQYFFNAGNARDIKKEMSALGEFLPEDLKQNLNRAYEAYLILEQNEDDENAQAILEECDDVFYENEDEINRLLEEYASKIDA